MHGLRFGWNGIKGIAVHPPRLSVKAVFQAYRDSLFCKPNLPLYRLKWARTELVIVLLVIAGPPVVSAPVPTWATSHWPTHVPTQEDLHPQLQVSHLCF